MYINVDLCYDLLSKSGEGVVGKQFSCAMAHCIIHHHVVQV